MKKVEEVKLSALNFFYFVLLGTSCTTNTSCTTGTSCTTNTSCTAGTSYTEINTLLNLH